MNLISGGWQKQREKALEYLLQDPAKGSIPAPFSALCPLRFPRHRVNSRRAPSQPSQPWKRVGSGSHSFSDFTGLGLQRPHCTILRRLGLGWDEGECSACVRNPDMASCQHTPGGGSKRKNQISQDL